MYREFLNWAFAVTADGCKKECRHIFLMELISAYISKALSFQEYLSLITIIDKKIYLKYSH